MIPARNSDSPTRETDAGRHSGGRIRRLLAAAAIVLLIASLVLAAFIWGRPIWALLKDTDRIRQLVEGWRAWGWLGMIGLQLVQIVVAPLPGNLVAVAGGYAFGAGVGLLLCMIGVLLGSTIAFLLGRLFGRRLLRIFVSEARMNQFDAFVARRGPFYLFLLMLVPLNPLSDWLYYLAGMTAIPLPVFLLLVLAARLPSNLLETFIGSQMRHYQSTLYHLAWWQWTLTIAGLLLIAVLYYLNRRRIERFFMRFTRFPVDGG